MRTEPPELHQAVSLAIVLVDWELESPQVRPIPPQWKTDLQRARAALEEFWSELEAKRQSRMEAEARHWPSKRKRRRASSGVEGAARR